MSYQTEYRKIIVSLSHSKVDLEQGLLTAHFELFEDGTVDVINSTSIFCHSGQVFVPKGYQKLQDKYPDCLFLVKCWESQRGDGECKYVTVHEIENPGNNEKLPHGLVADLFIYDEDAIDLQQNTITSNSPSLTPFGYVYTKDQGMIGLLKFDIKEIKSETSDFFVYEAKGIDLVPKQIFKGNVRDYHTLQFEEMTLDDVNVKTLDIKGVPHSFVINYTQIESKYIAIKVDAIPLDILIKKGADALSKVTHIKGLNRENIRLLLKNTGEINNHIKSESRRAILKNILTYLNKEGINYKDEIVKSVLHTNEGQKFVNDYISTNKDEILKKSSTELDKELAELKSKKSQEEIKLEEELRDLKNQIKQKNTELGFKQLELEKEALDEEDFQRALEKNNKELENKRIEIDSEESKLFIIRQEYSGYNEIKLQENRIAELKVEAKKHEMKADIMKDTLKDAKKEFSDNAAMWRKEIFKAKEIFDVIADNHVENEIIDKKYQLLVPKKSMPDENDIISERDSVINKVVERFNKIGRKVSIETVTNLLTSLAQSQFVIFSGLPGSGKTSMALHLQTVLGIAPCSLTIPVFKGWTSPKDILGYYNTLTSRYNQGSTDLYSLLNGLSKVVQAGGEKEQALSIVLLDEFNLSQPEHYLSSFIEMADVSSKRLLHTGDPSAPTIKVPSYLRFICTANNDDTVQPLSPRMLDRASVVNFNQEMTAVDVEEFINDSNTYNVEPIISGESFIKLFTKNKSIDSINDETKSFLDRLYDILGNDSSNGSPTYISYRKRQNIINYVSVAQNSMEEKTAIDFAVVQHIIPLLRGEGDYEARLEELSQHIEKLEQSSKLIKRILRSGQDNFGTYGYMI
ncbi:MAG: MoxR-like ATPase [Salibacteraceae bacterium]|jgi:MoxR-like ATPase